jgi:hypothetical protein
VADEVDPDVPRGRLQHAGQQPGRGRLAEFAGPVLHPPDRQRPQHPEHAAAAGFDKALAAGKSPEEALTADAPEADWTWAFLELRARPGALGGTQQRAAFQFVSPYRGLSSVTERDADLFFGRRTEVTELLNTLRSVSAVGHVRRAAALALDRGVPLSEQGQPRYGLLSMAAALRTCPPADSGPDAAALRRVILTNLAGWVVKQLCLDHVRKFPAPRPPPTRAAG